VVYLVGCRRPHCVSAWATCCQQRAASMVPVEEVLSWRLLLDLLHRRVWLWGVAAWWSGRLLGGLALQLASVALVEPLLSASLAVRVRHRGRALRPQGALGTRSRRALLLSLALAAFLVVGKPRSSRHPHPDRFWTMSR